jgi:hypothetical protein
VSDNPLKLRSLLESRCHSHSLFGPLQAIPGKGTTAIAAKGVIQDRTTVIPMSATTDIPTRTRMAIIAGTTTATATIGATGVGATTTDIIGVITTASDTITVEGSRKNLRTQNATFGSIRRVREWTMAALVVGERTRSRHGS